MTRLGGNSEEELDRIDPEGREASGDGGEEDTKKGSSLESLESALLPGEKIQWQRALERRDRLRTIRINLLVVVLTPILIALGIILPVALLFDGTSGWLLGAAAYMLYFFVCFRRRRRPLFGQKDWHLYLYPTFSVLTNLRVLTVQIRYPLWSRAQPRRPIFEVTSIPYTRIASIEIRHSSVANKSEVVFIAQNEAVDSEFGTLGPQQQATFSLIFPLVPSAELDPVSRIANLHMKQQQRRPEDFEADEPTPIDFDVSLDTYPASGMEREDLTTFNRASIDGYFREQTRLLFRSSSSSLSSLYSAGPKASATSSANVLWSHQDSLWLLVQGLAFDYAFVVLLLELLMLGVIACSTAISARHHDEEYHTDSEDGGLDDIHPGIPIGATFAVLVLAFVYPIKAMASFGQGFLGRRLHVISAYSASLICVHHSGAFNGAGAISFADMFPLRTTIDLSSGSGSLTPGVVEMPILIDPSIKRLELLFWKLFFRDHLRPKGQDPTDCPPLFRSLSSSSLGLSSSSSPSTSSYTSFSTSSSTSNLFTSTPTSTSSSSSAFVDRGGDDGLLIDVED